MARHANQRALTVNHTRVNSNPQPRLLPETSRRPALDALDDYVEDDSFDTPSRLGVSFHLLLTGQSRSGGLFNG